MKVLVQGFNFEPKVTFGGRIFKGPQDRISLESSIIIKCIAQESSTIQSTLFLGTYPNDLNILCGFLTWLNFRNRNPLISLRGVEFKVHSVSLTTSQQSIESAIATIIKGCIIPKGILFINTINEKPTVGDNLAVCQTLLSFATLLKQKGNDSYNSKNYNDAIDLYQSALLTIAEWERLLHPSVQKAWMELSLDILSNHLQCLISLKQYNQDEWVFRNGLQIISSAPYIEKRKRLKFLTRCAQFLRGANDHTAARNVLWEAFQIDATISRIRQFLQPYRTEMDVVFIINQALDGKIDATGSRSNAIISLPKEKITQAILDTQIDVCSICLQEYAVDDMTIILHSSHRFHEVCATAWLIKSVSCPICRETVISE